MIYDSKTDTSKWRRWVFERLQNITVDEGGSAGVSLGDLSDVSDATPNDRNFLIADGAEWVAQAHVLDDHGDATIVSPAQDEALVYNASTGQWENSDIALQNVSCIIGGNAASTFPELDVNPFGTTSPDLFVQEEGVTLATAASVINFVGADVTASGTGSTKTITIASGVTAPAGASGELQFNDAGAFGADPFLSVNLTASSGQEPQLILDGTGGFFRRPFLVLNYDSLDSGGIRFEEEGALRGEIIHHANNGGQIDQLLIENLANGNTDLESTIQLTTRSGTSRINKMTINRNGVTINGGTLRLAERFATDHPDTAGYGQLWIDNADANLHFTDENGVDRDLIDGSVGISGTPVDGQIGIWTGSTLMEGDADFTWNNPPSATSTLTIGNTDVGTRATTLHIKHEAGYNGSIMMSEGTSDRFEIRTEFSNDVLLRKIEQAGSVSSVMVLPITTGHWVLYEGDEVTERFRMDVDTGFYENNSAYFHTQQATDTELNDVTNAINTSAKKIQGAMIYNTTQDVPVWAVGNANGSVWVDGAGTTVNTPV